MIVKNKDAESLIREKVEKVFEYNSQNPQSPVNLLSIEISRGLYNYLKNDDSMLRFEGTKYKLKDNEEYGLFIFIRFK